MRKFFFGIVALVAMVATSCQQSLDELNVVGSGDATVTLNVGASSRAYSDGKTATHLQWGVYHVENGTYTYLNELYGENEEFNGNQVVSLDLAIGNTYAVVFWAAAPAAPYSVDFAAKTMTANYDGAVCNDENRDAFYTKVEFEVAKDMAPVEATLKRPFAQLNIGTNDLEVLKKANYEVKQITVTASSYTTLNLIDGTTTGNLQEVEFDYADIATDEQFPVAGYDYLAMNYLLMGTAKETIDVKFTVTDGTNPYEERTVGSVPVQRNHRTNLYGKLFSNKTDINVEIKPGYDDDNKYGVIDGQVYVKVADAAEFNAAFADENIDIIILTDDIVLNETLTRADETATVKAGKKLTIDLNSKKLSATSSLTTNPREMFLVKGNLTVVNGTIEYEHTGENMAWNGMTTIFDITDGGVLNLDGVVAKNLGGTDMTFVAHLNNWGEATLNVDNSTLEATYIAVRAFNSGYDMNNITIKNSTLKGKYCFWVHNYKAAGDSAGTDETLNVDIYGNGNTFEYTGMVPVLYGFNEPIYEVAVKTEAELNAAIEAGYQVALDGDVVLENGVTIANGKNVVLKLYNNTLSAVDNSTGSYGLITNKGNLSIVGPGKLQLSATNNRAWNAYSSVISNTVGGNLVLDGGVVIEHLGGTDMAYGIDNLTNGKGTSAVTTVKEATVKSTYRAIRQFLNGVEATNELYVKAGAVVEGTNKSIWMQDPSKNANTGKLVVEAGAQLKGNVYLYVCEGSTEWPVEVSIASAALVDGSTVLNGNVPAGYEVVENNGVWSVVITSTRVNSAEALVEALGKGEDVVLTTSLSNVAVNTKAPYGNYYGIKLDGSVFDGNGNVLDFDRGELHNNKADNYGIMTSGGTIKNVTIGGVFRGIMIMNPTQDIFIDNATIGDEDVCYPINTGEGDGTHSLYISNTTIKGWNSYGTAIKSVTFSNCTFAQGEYYTDVYGRLTKPYVDAVYENCDFAGKYYIDLSQFGKDGDGNVLNNNVKLVLKNCTVNGVKLTAENWTSLIAPESSCSDEQISVELKDNSYLSATNVADYIVIE